MITSIDIVETTVASIEGYRIAVGNIWKREYFLYGMKNIGETAQISLLSPEGKEENTTVGEGSIVDIGSTQWQVSSCKADPSSRGILTLKRL